MDRIEPVGGSSDASEDHHLPSSNDPRPGATTSYLRPRAPSLRSRRPSIRIQRPPSVNSLNIQAQVNADKSNASNVGCDNALNPRRNSQISGPDGTRAAQNNGTPNGGDGDDGDTVWQGRRRSSSEPRPGRWSGSSSFVPPLLTVGDQANVMPMYSLKEEPSSPHSPVAELPSSQPFSTAHLEPPPVIPRRGSRNVLRRTSEAALNQEKKKERKKTQRRRIKQEETIIKTKLPIVPGRKIPNLCFVIHEKMPSSGMNIPPRLIRICPDKYPETTGPVPSSVKPTKGQPSHHASFVCYIRRIIIE